MNKKGFIFSLDALFALMIFFGIIITSTAYFSHVKFEAKNSDALKLTAIDALTALEKTGKLENAVNRNQTTEIRNFANKLPKNLCADISIFGENNFSAPQMSALKSGCKKNFTESATINRAFIARGTNSTNYFIARITVWPKVN